ncbi:MAG: hypothetical protein WC543_00165 [Candidatus Omnitrophota bacterium]
MVKEDNKLLERMRCSKSGWRFTDLEKLYSKYGFEKKEGGKHALFLHPDFPELRATVTRHNSLPLGYIQFAVKLIDKLEELQEGVWIIKD